MIKNSTSQWNSKRVAVAGSAAAELRGNGLMRATRKRKREAVLRNRLPAVTVWELTVSSGRREPNPWSIRSLLPRISDVGAKEDTESINLGGTADNVYSSQAFLREHLGFFICSVPLRRKKHSRQGGTNGIGKGSYSMIILKERWRSRSLNTKEINNWII